MFYIIFGKICIDDSSTQLNIIKHCVELNQNYDTN